MRSLTGYRSLIGYQTKEKGTCVQIRGEKLIRLVFWDRIQNSIRPVFWDGGSILDQKDGGIFSVNDNRFRYCCVC